MLLQFLLCNLSTLADDTTPQALWAVNQGVYFTRSTKRGEL